MPTETDTLQKDACELLDADHLAVKHLFVEYARLAYAPEGGEDRRAIALKACEEIAIHATIEEEIFYPALETALPAEAGLLAEAREEHQQAKDLIARIQATPDAGPELDALVAELARSIEHHVKEERDELFPKARTAPGLDLAALGEQMQARQGELAKVA